MTAAPPMTRASATLGSLLFLLLAPGTVAGVIPWWICHWSFAHQGLAYDLMRWAGGPVILLGLALLLACFAQFAWQGMGTPAPVAPTQRLVVSGAYRRVRNPMYLAVLALILGQALLFGNARVAAYGLAVFVLFHTFVITYEEPKLRASFPHEYARFFAAVPRWIPRLRPWSGG
jgi:protein-S-isoprenylcysteine O-methyltransferase Ste14